MPRVPKSDPGATEIRSRKIGAKGAARRDAIMDAAEAVFAERGYYGSSLREISSKSEAALGLINHYFSSKEDLYTSVVDRKRDLLAKMVSDSIREGRATSKDSSYIIIASFITPFLRACAQRSPEIGNYIRLTSHFMSSYDIPEIRPALTRLQPISDIFRDQLIEVLDVSDIDKLSIGLYLIEAALIFMVQDRGFLKSITAARFDTADVNELIRPAATFFAAGLAALVSPEGYQGEPT